MNDLFHVRKIKKILGLTIVFGLFVFVLAACGGGGGAGSDDGANVSSGSRSGGSTGAAVTVNLGAPNDADLVINMANFSFSPKELRVKAGATVTFQNDDQIAHDVIQSSPDKVNGGKYGFESPQIMPGESWTYTFHERGTYPILCTVGSHYLLGMTAEVIVE